MKTITVNDRQYPVDADGVIDMPIRRQSMRYTKGEELREFSLEWYAGAQGVTRLQVSRVVIQRISRQDFARSNAARRFPRAVKKAA